MNYKSGILTLALIAGALLPTGCNRQRDPAPAQQQYYQQQNAEVWVGPGWYYGVYFSTEPRYRAWRRSHWGYGPYYRGYGRHYRWGGRRYYYGNRGYRGGRGRHHGGGRRSDRARGGRGRR